MMDVKDSSSTTIDKKLKTINPATEEVLNEYTIISKEQLNDTVKQSRNAFLEWKKDIDKRADFLYAFAKELDSGREMCADSRVFCRSWKNITKKNLKIMGNCFCGLKNHYQVY